MTCTVHVQYPVLQRSALTMPLWIFIPNATSGESQEVIEVHMHDWVPVSELLTYYTVLKSKHLKFHWSYCILIISNYSICSLTRVRCSRQSWNFLCMKHNNMVIILTNVAQINCKNRCKNIKCVKQWLYTIKNTIYHYNFHIITIKIIAGYTLYNYTSQERVRLETLENGLIGHDRNEEIWKTNCCKVQRKWGMIGWYQTMQEAVLYQEDILASWTVEKDLEEVGMGS